MTEVRFARTRYEYQPYVDYWALVELSGFKWDYIDEMKLYDENLLYIVSPMNGEFRPHLDNHKDRTCKIAHWLLERPGGSPSLAQFISANQELVDQCYVDFNIVSDPVLAKKGSWKYVPMGSHEGLGEPGLDKHYDFIGLMAYSNRRGFLFHEPGRVNTSHGGLTFAPNAWGERRHILLQESRFGINVHQDDHMICEPIRMALFASYGLPILTEFIPEHHHFYGDAVASWPLENLLEMGREMKVYYDQWAPWGEWLRYNLTLPFSFRACLERWL